MWRRTYIFLLIVRFYCALCPSYLHPDENFQGPEAIAGRIFSYPVHETWEFNSEAPIRSAFTLWPVYGLPMLILKWLWEGSGHGLVPPSVVFWTLRLIMFGFSFVLEDWAIYDLFDTPRLRRIAVMLVASSYVTWSWQVHTFSNSIETLLVLWSLVLIQRLRANNAQHSPLISSGLLAFLLVYGTFNRITFPAFLLYPLIRLIPHIWRRPLTLLFMAIVAGTTALAAIITDTVFFSSADISFVEILRHPIVTPLNSLLYNTKDTNLAIHGTHPFYLHFTVNLPQMLGPVFPLLFGHARYDLPFVAALCGVVILSFFSHQEARFIIPAIPLMLSSVRLPYRYARTWLGIWVGFNVLLGVLMSVYHQGGVVPAQIYLETQPDVVQAFWWKTYSPPVWLLNGRNENTTTIDLMGLDSSSLESRVCMSISKGTVLVAPRSATFLDRFSVAGVAGSEETRMQLQPRWTIDRHLNLDDIDVGEDGVLGSIGRVIGRRGLVIWDVKCRTMRANIMHRDW